MLLIPKKSINYVYPKLNFFAITSSSAMAKRPREAWWFSINVQRYSHNHAQNCILGPPYEGIRNNISAISESLAQWNFVAEFHSENASFTLGKGIKGNVCDSSLAGWKARGGLSIGYNCISVASSYGWRTYTSKSAFVDGWVTFGLQPNI